jgi:hypothetical protein
VVLDTLRARNVVVGDVFDDADELQRFAGRTARPGVFSDRGFPMDTSETAVIICVGANAMRADIATFLPGDFATSFHPNVGFASGATSL